MEMFDKLENENIEYKYLTHRPAYCAQKLAQEEHAKGKYVAKPVIIKADGTFYMCVLPACCKIDFEALKTVLQTREVYLANEKETENLFPDCEVGAEPPFGSLYGLPTILDNRLLADEWIIFQGGTHENAIKVRMKDYRKIESPKVYSFSRHI